MRQAHKPQSMFWKPQSMFCLPPVQGSTDTAVIDEQPQSMFKEAWTQRRPQEATLAEKLWGSKEGLVQTAKHISTIMLDV